MKIRAIKVLSVLVLAFSVEGITLSALYQPIPIALLVTACLTVSLLLLSQLTQEHILLQKKQKTSMIFLALWVLFSVYDVVISLSVLIYLSEYQLHEVQRSAKFETLMVFPADSSLSFQQISWINMTYYFGISLSIGFYARAYYRFFWVNNIVNIYRFLRKKVKHLNETLLSGLPVINLEENLDLLESICSLCLEQYNMLEEVTKLPCGHAFHRNCIRIWVVRSNACPLCRKRVIFS